MGRAEEAGDLVGGDDAADDDQRGERGGLQRHRKALDDVGAVTGDGSLRDRDDRTLAGAGVVLGDDDDEPVTTRPTRPQAKRPAPVMVTPLAVPMAPQPMKVVASARPTIDRTPVTMRPL